MYFPKTFHVLIPTIVAALLLSCSSSSPSDRIAIKTEDYMKPDEVFAGYMDDQPQHFSATQYGIAVLQKKPQKEGEPYTVQFFRPADEGLKLTRKVILETHPANREELKKGMVVLCNFFNPESGANISELRAARWELNLIRSVSGSKATVDFFFNKHTQLNSEDHRVKQYWIQNIRIVDEPVISKQ